MKDKQLDNESDILKKIAEGDETAFSAFYRHYYPRLNGLVNKYFHTGIEAQDVLQLAFLKVWLNRDKLPEIVNVYGWLYRIAYREFLMALRSRLNYEAGIKEYSGTLTESISFASVVDLKNLQELQQSIQEVVNSLAPQRRAIYELSRNEGLKIEEIAKRLNITAQTVKNVLTLVLKMIREHLIKKGFGPFMVTFFLKLFYLPMVPYFFSGII